MSTPTALTIRSLRSSVNETPDQTTAAGSFAVAYIQLRGADANTVVSLTGMQASLFRLKKSSVSTYVLELKEGIRLDFEQLSTPQLQVDIVASSTTAPGTRQASFTLAVSDVNEAPTAGPAVAVSVAENTSAVGTYAARDVDAGDVLTYSLAGPDAGSFTINASSGALSFRQAPDFEAPGDTDADNIYQVEVVATDRAGLSVSRPVAVTVTDVAEGPPIIRISDIQGAGETSPLVGQTVTVQARVTAWKPGLNLFFLEEESADRDANETTSEGIAVFYGTLNPGIGAASIGDIVRLTGTVAEFKAAGDGGLGTLTQLTSISGFQVIRDGSAADLEAPTPVKLPIATGSTLERFEGMQVEVSSASPGGRLFVADTFTFARFGEFTLHADAVPVQFTEQNLPSAAGFAAYQDQLQRNSIQLEDGSSAQNPSLAALNAGSMILRDTTDDAVPNGTPMGVQAGGGVNFIRVGDNTASVSGVLSYGFGAYELQPTQAVQLTANPRPMAPPDVGAAEVKVASFNVLNYFTTLGTASFTTPAGNSIAARGASTAAEFAQQQAKTVAAMLATDADVFGINELQNNGDGAGSAISSLVDALNAAVGSPRFAFVAGHATGSDAIRVGIIYDRTVVSPLGAAATPNTAAYDAFAANNRLPVAQTFQYVGDGSKTFTLVVNHLKSKGSSSGLPGDADQGDGQGASNATRLAAVQQLDQWLQTNPTGALGQNLVLVGDLNAYRMEDPVRRLEALGYTHQGRPQDYSYVFDGLRGSLDHVLTRGLDAAEITGVAHFNINADEQIALDYNDEFGDGSVNRDLDRNDAFRSSDHDPVVLGLRLQADVVQPPVDSLAPVLISSNPADDATAVSRQADIILNFNEPVALAPGYQTGGIRLVSAADGAVLRNLTAAEIVISGGVVTLNPSGSLAASTAYAVQIDAGAIRDAAGNPYAGIADTTSLNFTTAAAPASPAVFVTELHYDNAGSDVGEAIGISGPAGLRLTGWSLVLYNGNPPASATTYNATGVSGPIDLSALVFDDEGAGRGEVFLNVPGLQNGGNDGFALLNADGDVVQLLSYEGVFTAANGPAAGLTSMDIGAFEDGTDAAGGSLQLVNGAWVKRPEHSFGSLNQADVSAPVLLGSSPADNATEVAPGADIVLTFNETVTLSAGFMTGDIRLVSVSDGSVLRNLGASEVSVNGAVVTLNPAMPLAAGTAHAVQISAGVLADAAGNSYAGIADTSTLNFTTAAAVAASLVYTENFDGLANTAGSMANSVLPTGWAISEAGGGARDNELYAVDTGASTTGDTYSYGSAGSTDRALGGLQSGTLIPTIGAGFLNSSGQTVTRFELSYTGEQWRLGGTTGRQDRLDFQYSLDATSLSTGTWVDANLLDFLAPVTGGAAGALNGNLAANRVMISAAVTGLSIAPGQVLWIRWLSVDVSGADDGLAIDDVTIRLVGSPDAVGP